jgi:predicted nucleic acid-binding protein
VDILTDANILIRRIHRADPQHIQAREALNRLAGDSHRLCVTSQNLIELWTVYTRPIDVNGLGLSPAQTERILARVEHSLVRLGDSDDVYPEWRKLVALHAVSGKKAHDARLVAAMNVHRIVQILTFNVADFARYPSISVIEPSSIAPAV